MVRTSKSLARLRGGATARICGLGHFIPAYIGMAARAGFDMIWLDLEHREFDAREVQTLLALCHHFDIDCLLRPCTKQRGRLYRYLEDGATALMIPHVTTADEARALVDAVKFPPIGNRGLDGVGMDHQFALPAPDYVEQANRETMLVVQIESVEAVENVDQIAAIEGLDGMFVGPGDLGLRLRQQPKGMSLDDAFARVAEAADKHGKSWGAPAADAEAISRLHQRGGRLIAHGGEFFALHQMLERSITTLNDVCAD